MERSVDLVADNVVCLKHGIELLKSISDDQYGMADSTIYSLGGVGKHFRHIIDFYSGFLSVADNLIDYEKRERDPLLETDRERAEQRLAAIIVAFETGSVCAGTHKTGVSVTSSESSSYSRAECTASTIGRELQFLISHTIHHYAIIALMLRVSGIKVPEDFGVAPSTLRHLKTEKA